MTLAELVGRQLVFGLTGPGLSDADVRLFQETGAGGVILYRRNFDSPARLVQLLQELEAALGRRLLVTTDHEGGRVVMLGGAVTIFPDGLAIGAQSSPREVELQGRIEGRELRRLGIDVAFAPVVDVLGESYSPNIGIRAYGRDPDRVATLGAARVRGLQASGVSACVKHFPGQGPGPVDAHLALPVIAADWSEMRARHLVPFRAAAEAGVHAIMTSHPFYPALDSDAPATFSRRLVAELIRGELGYRGVIVSDDLEMGAIEALAPVGEAAVRAAAAGHDLLLVCHSERAQRAAHAALHEAYRSGERPRTELEASLERIDRLQAARSARFAGGPPHADPDGASLASVMARQGARIVAGSSWGSARPGRDGLLAVFPRLSALADRITVEPAMRDEADWLRVALGRHGVTSEDSSRILLVGVEPTPAEIERAAAAVQAHPATVLFLYDAHLYPSNRALLDAVQAKAPRLAVVLMRDPWDADWLGPGVTGVTGFGWRACQLEAALERLLG